MTGRVIIVTGANTGLGYRAAELLCDAGNDVVLACRDEEKAKVALEKIFKKTPNALATFMQLDLSDLSSVKKFVEDFHATGKKLHVLLNNAGVFLKNDTKRQFTKENFELTMGTNYLGHFLLTQLLLDDLKKTASEGGDSRIVNVTSLIHDPTMGPQRGKPREPLDLEDFFLDKQGSYNGMQAYKNSKAAVILSTYELARQLQDSKVKVNCLCPGFIPRTGLTRHASGRQRFFAKYIVGSVLRPVVKVVRTVDQGAKAMVDLCVNEELKEVTGKYFRDMKEAQSSEETNKEDLQKALYELSARYCHLEGYEPLDAPTPPPEEPKVRTKSKKEKKAASEETPGPSDEGEKAEEAKPNEKESDDKIDIKFADEDDKPEESSEKKDEKETSDKVEVVSEEKNEKETSDKTVEVSEKKDEKDTSDKPDEEKKEEETVNEIKDEGKVETPEIDGKVEVPKEDEKVTEDKQEEEKNSEQTESAPDQQEESKTNKESTDVEKVEEKTEDTVKVVEDKKVEELDKQVEETTDKKIEESDTPPAVPSSEVPEL